MCLFSSVLEGQLCARDPAAEGGDPGVCPRQAAGDSKHHTPHREKGFEREVHAVSTLWEHHGGRHRHWLWLAGGVRKDLKKEVTFYLTSQLYLTM